MDLSASSAERAAAYLQLFVTLGLVWLCWVLHGRYRKRYFGIWALAWSIYALRVVAIVTFLQTGRLVVALLASGHDGVDRARAPLGRARLLAEPRVEAELPGLRAAPRGVVVRRDLRARQLRLGGRSHGRVPERHDGGRRGPSTGTTASSARPPRGLLVVVLALWALHHLDYPFLRAQGVWNPWGYYLDIVFQMGMGLGILFLVLEDLDQGLRTLTALSSELQGAPRRDESTTEAVLRRALGLRGVHGSALYLRAGETAEEPSGGPGVPSFDRDPSDRGRFVHGAGVAALWPFERPPASALESARRVSETGVPVALNDPGAGGEDASWTHAYTAALPILRDRRWWARSSWSARPATRSPSSTTVSSWRSGSRWVHRSRTSACTNLEDRTEELERLQARMVRQHEEERNRLWRELHDETAQVLAALNMQLGMLQERSDASMAPALERAKTLVGEGIRSIRSVTRNLRPMALDDLGLYPR
jgi:hypothetical protein